MSVNRYQSHVLVLPEDRANGELATGFVLGLDLARQRSIQVLPEARGWGDVLDSFESVHIAEMDRHADRFMILLIDLDTKAERLEIAKGRIPERLAERVFILGAWSEPERLKASLGPYETIGLRLAQDCRDETDSTWEHELLRHNAAELNRLRAHVRPFLFTPRS